jgi:hypothetical protein
MKSLLKICGYVDIRNKHTHFNTVHFKKNLGKEEVLRLVMSMNGASS